MPVSTSVPTAALSASARAWSAVLRQYACVTRSLTSCAFSLAANTCRSMSLSTRLMKSAGYRPGMAVPVYMSTSERMRLTSRLPLRANDQKPSLLTV